MREYGNVTPYQSDKTKMGKYHGSMFWDIPDFASKRWVVAARVKVLETIQEDLTDDEIARRCVEYINTPPPRKKFQRRVRHPKYGTFELYRSKVTRTESDIYVTALLITSKRKSKHFWGKGIVTGK